MEQVIKFRMWNNVKDNPSASKMFYDTDEVMECLKQQLLFNDKSHKFHSLGYDHCGDGNVFMQFTGLFDKHGNEIYCGDKLQKIYEDKCEEGGFGKTIVDVAFKDGAFGWIGEITGNFHPFAVEPFEDSEIIGNIHQNSK